MSRWLEGRNGRCGVSELLHYRLTRKGRELTSEIVCRRHFEATPSMQALTESEKHRAGYVQTVTPYSGVRECETCQEERERAQGAA